MEQQPLLPYQNPLTERLGDRFFKQIPKRPGIYKMIGLGGHIIYVGKAKSLRARLASYRRARPHQVSRKVMRLIHVIEEIQYELCESEAAALLRENELLRLHRPHFNVVNTEPESYYFLGVREREGPGAPAIEFMLTTRSDFEPEWRCDHVFGAFKGGARVREGYQRLLRVLWATQASQERFEFPQLLMRYRVPYRYEWRLREGTPHASVREWTSVIQRFLRGTSDQLLARVTEELLLNPSIPPFFYHLIQEDLDTLRAFYLMAPKRNRDVRASLGLGRALIPQTELDDLLVLSKAKRGLRF
jgi:excinuclease ABC subunit C